MASYLPRIGLFGASSATGGWVLEGALERGHEVRALTPSVSSLADYASKITVVKGSSRNFKDMQGFVYDDNEELLVDVIICVRKEKECWMQDTAAVLVKVLQNKTNIPRIVWMTGVHHQCEDGAQNAKDVMVTLPEQPEQPCFPTLLGNNDQFACFFPFLSHLFGEKDIVGDMQRSEESMQENATIQAKTVVVRPTRMQSLSTAPTFSQAWRRMEDETNHFYQFVQPTTTLSPELATAMVYRRAVATALLDLAFDENRDGTVVDVYKREKSVAPIVAEQVDL